MKKYAKVVKVGNYYQVLIKEGNSIKRMTTLGDFMKWECQYNSIQSIEKKLHDIWGYKVVKTFKEIR